MWTSWEETWADYVIYTKAEGFSPVLPSPVWERQRLTTYILSPQVSLAKEYDTLEMSGVMMLKQLSLRSQGTDRWGSRAIICPWSYCRFYTCIWLKRRQEPCVSPSGCQTISASAKVSHAVSAEHGSSQIISCLSLKEVSQTKSSAGRTPIALWPTHVGKHTPQLGASWLEAKPVPFWYTEKIVPLWDKYCVTFEDRIWMLNYKAEGV